MAAGLGPLALGTDGGGSIRRPASHAGLVGLKPSIGRVPRCDGLPAILLDLEQIGPIARTSADLVAFLALLVAAGCARSRLPRHAALRGAAAAPRQRILFVPRLGTNPVDPEIATSVAIAAAQLSRLGHQVEEGEAPFTLDESNALFGPVGQAGLAWLLAERGGEPAAPMLREMAAAGRALAPQAVFGAVDGIAAFRRRMAGVLRRLGPDPDTGRRGAALAGRAGGAAGDRRPARGPARPCARSRTSPTWPGCPASRCPAAAVGGGPADRLPAGRAFGADGLLCAMAAEWEAARPWADRWPEL